MSKTPLTCLTSSAEAGETDDDLLDYAKLIETFRAIDKNNRGYLSKKQYKRFLHEMKIYYSDDFANISYRALAVPNPNPTEHQEQFINGFRNIFMKSKPPQANCDSDDESQSSLSSSTRSGITFDNARIVCEAFFSPSFDSESQSTKTKITLQAKEKDKNGDFSQSEGFSRSASEPIQSNNPLQANAKKNLKRKKHKNQTKNKLCSLILFRGVDDDKDGRINAGQFNQIAHIIDQNLAQEEINQLYQSCMPSVYDETVSYSNVARVLFDVFMWGEENPYMQNFSNYLPSSQVCILI